MNYNAFFAKQEYFICFVHHFILCFLINLPLPESCCHSMHCSISRNIKTCYFFVKMRLAFFQMRHALGGNAPCFWVYARRILGKARRILGVCHFGPVFSSRLAQLLIDEVNLAGGEAEAAVAVGNSLKFGFQHGVGLHEAQHLLACPHGGVALKVEAGQLGKSDGSHTGTPPFWARAFWMML